MDTVQTVVIGAGVVGLAVARELARSGREVVILEKENAFGTITSARNSEVIHAGIYYEPGSLKARLCVEGRVQLIEFCRRHGVAFRLCGKLIVAEADAQRTGLEKIERRARAAGVASLRWLTGAEAQVLEPALRCRHALISPDTGIVDSHGLMLALLGAAEERGATLALLSGVTRGEVHAEGFDIEVSGEDGPMHLRCRELVNAAGLGAQGVASRIEGLKAGSVPPLHLAKGNYFALAGRCPFSRLIYPIPNEAGLGVHLTLDLAGQGRFGPDVEWTDRIDYDVDPHRGDGFYAEIRSYWPELPDGALQPAYSGMRPKLVGPEAAAADFRIDGASVHGAPGLVNLFGIESPGLTASLAIAAQVRAALDDIR
jgi:L-2-hydroxyglutarate oxidase LhgO